MDNSSEYAILHRLSEATLVVDRNYHIIFANQTYLDFCKMPSEQILGKKCHEIIHHCPNPCEKATLENQPCPHHQVFSSGLPQTTQHSHTMDDGTCKIIEISTSPLFDDSGQVVKILQVMRDVSDRQLIQDQLQNAKNEWEKTFDAMSDIITLMDKDLRIVRANKATYDFFNVQPGEINGTYCYELFRGANEPCVDCPAFDTLHDACCHHHDKIVHEKLDKIFHVSSSPIFDTEGKLQYLVHIAKDVTEVTKLQEDLFQAHKMEAVGALAGGIAHDFNNILTAILGYSELAYSEMPEPSPCRQYLAQVIKAGDRARELINQILTFSRKSPQQSVPMSPVVIVKEVVKLLRASLPSTVKIQDNIDQDCGAIIADPIQVHQILINLCTNAFQSMPDQKGTLRISLSATTDSAETIHSETPLPQGPLIKLEVSDTGNGIDKATKKRIFDPYFTTKEIGKGTGMGLAVVHGIVKSHGGSIRVASELGKGSTFSVYFPAHQNTAVEHQENSKTIVPTGNESILVVDDEITIVTMLQSMLERLGYRVMTKTAGDDALLEFKSHPDHYDLVITDQTMPQMTGAELAKSLLKIKPGLPIILCTGHSAIISEYESKKIGINQFVTKPISSTALATMIRHLLDEQKKHPASTAISSLYE